MIDNIGKEDCTGCKMCGDLCVKDAITFEEDKNGFWYPKVDETKCIRCGICVKRCPSIKQLEIDNYKNPTVYAAWSIDDDVRLNSTSGGVYYEIAKKFIEEGGYIAGCTFSDDFKSAYHIVGNSLDDLKRIMGSKYFQSDTAGIYKKVNKLLQRGEKVLFCGTPCQIAAIKSYLGSDCKRLYSVDFICKGINSPKAYREYIKEQEIKYKSKVIFVKQKSKKTGWQSLATNMRFENGKEYHKDRYSDWWIQGYTCGNLFMRENCQNCRYKDLPRLADISMGDFWKITRCDDKDMEKGISVVFSNSEKGDAILAQIKDRFHIEERTMQEVLKGNPYLFGQAHQKGDRERFFDLLDSVPFSEAVKETYTETVVAKFKRYMKLILKKMGRKGW